jgi:hypothetical protein
VGKRKDVEEEGRGRGRTWKRKDVEEEGRGRGRTWKRKDWKRKDVEEERKCDKQQRSEIMEEWRG